ncbi:hypothetical protein JCM19239_1118 [Vibrio variabilis]|uniref:Uncharacterized protein n=1 Tax=Vibrio variabilis TaxID=990271 RepID=A0ABQ0JEB5_9VIBR|nr:hypothetical protein JCM19239_1118 [Vibrio variabilis]
MTELGLTLPVVISLLTSILTFFARRHLRVLDYVSGISVSVTFCIAIALLVGVLNGGLKPWLSGNGQHLLESCL